MASLSSNGRTPEREETDDSLRTERARTDEELRRRDAATVDEAERVVEHARALADRVLAAAERRSDSARQPTPGVEDRRREERASLEAERESADEDLETSQDASARALAAVLRVERASTDARLEVERRRSDRATSSRDEFLAIASHDLRAMLGGLALNAALVVRRSAGKAEDTGLALAAARIQRLIGRMNRLVEDLIDVASLEAGTLRIDRTPVDVRALVQETLEDFEPVAAGAHLTLRCELPSSPVPAEVDAGRIRQVLANLVGNAVKFTPAGGAVSLGLRSTDDVELSVSDTGPGLSPADQVSVFERFWQADRQDRRGLGLGLYIARSIAEAHGGALRLDSQLGRGSTFRLTLPREVAASAAAMPDPVAPAPA